MRAYWVAVKELNLRYRVGGNPIYHLLYVYTPSMVIQFKSHKQQPSVDFRVPKGVGLRVFRFCWV